MKLAPGTPLAIGLLLNEAGPPSPVGRLAMAGGLAQLEWSDEVLETQRRVDPLLYPPEPGLQAARGRDFNGLHGFLADSLPDAWGRLLMKRRLEKMGVQLETLTAVDRLALVGNGGRGALVYRPATTPAEDVGTIDLDALAAQSQFLLLGEDTDLIDTLAKLGGASGGARPKVSIGIAADGTLGQNAAGDGHDEWIVKFRATTDPVDTGPVEEAYARMARAAGIAMAPSRLLPARDGPGYFATRRFDRPSPGRRLHMLSLAGALEALPDVPSLGYDGLRWIDEGYLVTKGVPIGAILYQEQLARAAEKIDIACTRGGGGHVMAVLDPYNPSGSTRHVNFITTKECWKTGAQPPRSQISHVVKDSSWEIALAQALEGHSRVLAYAKNQALGFEIPYLDGGAVRRYVPDFLVRLGTGGEPLNLVLEMKGQRDESDKAKAQTACDLWVPGVNALGGYGRWAFAEFTDPYTTEDEFTALVTRLIDGAAA